MQFREQVGPLRAAGVATVAFDAFGCGSSAKPRDPLAYAPGELYADIEAVYEKYCKVSTEKASLRSLQGSCFQERAWQRYWAPQYRGHLLHLQGVASALAKPGKAGGHKHL